jgi:hypothetical protein
MKKITLLIALAVTSFSFAQIVDRPENGVNSIIATEGDDGTGVYCGDSFTTTDSFELTDITFSGTNSNGAELGPFLTGLNVVIYADAGGDPGSGVQPQLPGFGVVELQDIDAANFTVNTDTGGVSSFTVDLVGANGGSAPVLPAGTYWMVCFPSVTGAPADGAAGRWNWALSDGPAPINSILIDPQDLFGAGATDWTELDTLVPGATSFAWTLNGDVVLGVDDNALSQISIYPNPSSDVVNIKVPSSIEITGSALYDVLGKRTGVQVNNGVLDISSLARGVYLLNVETTAGTLTEKIIKR